MYCHVQREQDNKTQKTGTNSCPFSLNHTNRYKYNAMQRTQCLRLSERFFRILLCYGG